MIPELTEKEIARFHSKIKRGDGCWLWDGETGSNGYGYFSIYRDGRRVRLLAHRVAYLLAVGEDPGDAVVRHGCDTPPCCNSAHLRTGTQKDNIGDAVTRGRLDTSGLAAHRDAREAAAFARLASGQKTCSGCRVTKALDAFCRASGNVDGRSYWCKQCRGNQQRARRRQREVDGGGLSERQRRKLPTRRSAVAA